MGYLLVLMYGGAAGVDTSLPRCRVRYLFFTSYGLGLATTCMSASSLQIGGEWLHASPAKNSTILIEKGEVDLRQPCRDFYPYPPPFFLCWSEPTLAIRIEELAKGLYQENARPANSNLRSIDYKYGLFTNWAILSSVLSLTGMER